MSFPRPVPAPITDRYDVALEEVRAGDFTWSMLVVPDTNRLLDAISPSAFTIDERLPYWAELWSSSITLAHHLRVRPGVAGARVLELGCGLGLAGIAAAQAGAIVTMTDYEEDALAFARINVEKNLDAQAGARVTITPMDWRHPPALGKFDLVIGADIVYERPNFTPLLSMIRATVRPGGAALITDPGRSIGEDFLHAARGQGCTVMSERIPLQRRGIGTTVVLSELRFPKDVGQPR